MFNMELFEFNSAVKYEKAMLSHYQSDPRFINNKSGIFHIVCNPAGAFYQNTVQKMIGVKSGNDGRRQNEILCQCVLIKHNQFDALTVAFFEAQENVGEAVRLMMDYAADYGRHMGAKRMIAALDGHCNYGIGFSRLDPHAAPLFGESRNPEYYNAYFENGYYKIGFSSFWGELDDISNQLNGIMQRIEERTTQIKTQCADFRQFPVHLRRYTDLSNQIFAKHWYYFHRTYNEDLELFKTMKPLLSPCNLIFAQKNGRDIGYSLFYPDFNELVPIGGEANAGTFLKHKLLHRPIHTVKIAEIGILPEYHSSAVVLTLFREVCRQVKRQYPHIKRVVSSWIMDENTASQNITRRFAPNLYGSYAAYEKEI